MRRARGPPLRLFPEGPREVLRTPAAPQATRPRVPPRPSCRACTRHHQRVPPPAFPLTQWRRQRGHLALRRRHSRLLICYYLGQERSDASHRPRHLHHSAQRRFVKSGSTSTPSTSPLALRPTDKSSAPRRHRSPPHSYARSWRRRPLLPSESHGRRGQLRARLPYPHCPRTQRRPALQYRYRPLSRRSWRPWPLCRAPQRAN